MSSVERKSNWELLRIISMLMIVSGHFLGQTMAPETTTGTNLFFVCFAGSGARVAVNLFLLIGTWFMVDSIFRPDKFLKLYFQTAFFTIGLSLVLLLLGWSYSKAEMVRCFLPFTLRPVWFASSWMALMLLSPYLKKMCSSLSYRELKNVVIIGFVLISVMSSISPKRMDNWLCALIWFCYVYVFMFYYKNFFCWHFNFNAKYALLGGGSFVCSDCAVPVVLHS